VKKHNFFRLNQIEAVIQNRITASIRLNAQKLNMFCSTLYFMIPPGIELRVTKSLLNQRL